MKKVLYIAFCYPPLSGIASLRALKTVKYLPHYGWEPYVLTILPTDFLAKGYDIDMFEETDSVSVTRTSFKTQFDFSEKVKFPDIMLEVKKFICDISSYPDWFSAWRETAYVEGLKLIKENDIDLIYSTSDPVTSHFVAKDLSYETGVKWIAEFRDLWTDGHLYNRNSILKIYDENAEKDLLSSAHALVTVSEPLKRILEEKHNKQTFVIMNGFDQDDYKDIVIEGGNKFSMVYTGTYYHTKQNINILFEVLVKLRSEEIITSADFELLFYGNFNNELKLLIENYGLNDFVRQCGHIKFKESIQKQKEASMLLFMDWMDKRFEGIYSGKIFEYLGARKNILAIGKKKGVVYDLIQTTKAGEVLETFSEITDFLVNKTQMYKKNISLSYSGIDEEINKYTRKIQTGKLANILDKYQDV